jgi:hypothetical protein
MRSISWQDCTRLTHFGPLYPIGRRTEAHHITLILKKDSTYNYAQNLKKAELESYLLAYKTAYFQNYTFLSNDTL